MAHEQKVPVERVGSIIDMFVESTGLISSAGGQGTLIIMALNPEQLLGIANKNNATIYYEETSVPGNISTTFERKYLVSLPEGAWEWKESIPTDQPANVTASYDIKAISKVPEPGIYQVSYEKDTTGSLIFYLIVAAILSAIGACIINWLWGLIAKD